LEDRIAAPVPYEVKICDAASSEELARAVAAYLNEVSAKEVVSISYSSVPLSKMARHNALIVVVV
jgi:hypothetical protein